MDNTVPLLEKLLWVLILCWKCVNFLTRSVLSTSCVFSNQWEFINWCWLSEGSCSFSQTFLNLDIRNDGWRDFVDHLLNQNENYFQIWLLEAVESVSFRHDTDWRFEFALGNLARPWPCIWWPVFQIDLQYLYLFSYHSWSMV